MLRPLAIACALALLAGAPLAGTGARPILAAQDGGVAQRRDALQGELITQLERYAQWCQSKRLFSERDATYARILTFDANHADARRTLGHKKKGGEWIEPKKSKPVKNFDEDALLEAPDRFYEFLQPVVTQLAGLLDDDSLSRAERNALQLEVLSLDPDHRGVHTARGEVRWNGRWVLEETATGARRRAALGAIVHDGFVDAPEARPGTPNAKEAAFGLNFGVAVTPELRVLASTDKEDAFTLATSLHAARDSFASILGRTIPFPVECSVYVLRDTSDMASFLDHHPMVDANMRRSLSGLEGSGVPGTMDWAFWTGPKAKRADGILRMAFGYMLRDAFEVTIKHGWVHEGFGLYLTKALVGTRLTWFIDTSYSINPEMAFAARNRLLDPATNWMSEARDLFESSKPPNLRSLFGKTSTSLTVEDIVCAYALAAYLIEGYPDEVARAVLSQVGNNLGGERAFQNVLGLEVDEIGPRVARWIRETNAEEFAPALDASRMSVDWESLGAAKRATAIELFQTKLAALDTQQLKLIRRVCAEVLDVAAIEDAPPLEYYDPKKHAPRLAIRRRWLNPDDRLVRDVHRTVFGVRDPRALIESYAYDWGRRKIVRTGDPNDVETLFANATNGYPPGLDLAVAIVEQALDDGSLQKHNAAFDHVYTDRDGGVYPGTTLYDVWSSDLLLEMPDIDALGIMHDVFNDWDTWVSPIAPEQHGRLYGLLERQYKQVRAFRTLREELARLLFVGELPTSKFVKSRTNLHALWAHEKERQTALAKSLPPGTDNDIWLQAWVDRCFDEGKLYTAGEQRHKRLVRDGDEIVRILTDALNEADLRGE